MPTMYLASIVINIEVPHTDKFILLFKNLDIISRTKKHHLKKHVLEFQRILYPLNTLFVLAAQCWPLHCRYDGS